MFNMICILLIVVSLILMTITVILVINCYRKLKNYKECVGVIINFYEGTSLASDNFGQKMISPIISYTVNGKNYEFIGNYCSTSMKVGQEIKILYNKENPAKATIKDGLYFAPIITGSLAVLFTFFLVIFCIYFF